ncbi:response regulator [Lusitaniella coriacea LEGE 07157]|uniref:Response regulator n=1 Tax=Lusitaniella coriacea LEGE 07157 TaxID=945747 RepID=A0A8J7DU04_9CYAN|nr:adenylate/guanylate cyclase domain-containing protein [Lusitaniella coriacea]MBE9114666.1 response regulator [Lusitaniella coriacea LEGE 07157]
MSKPVIICIDDEITILDSLKIQLKKALGSDYLIETALGGEDALELIDELLEDGYEIALAISDYIMPDIKGDELLKQIHELSPKTLKIMLTGQADLEAVANAINYAKLYRYIAKPWQSEDLSLTVSEALYSYFQDKKLAAQNLELHHMNQALEQANREQAKLIAQLQENENRLQQFLEGVPVGMVVFEATGKLYYLNSRAEQLLNKGLVSDATPEQFPEIYRFYQVGKDRLYPWQDIPGIRALGGESTRVDNIEIRQADRCIPLEVWGTPIYNAEGEIIYAIAAFQDITERKQAEAERAQFTQELLQLNQANERFVPNQFLQLLDKQSIVEVKVGESVEQEMSILFSDIRAFTTLSEQMSLEDNFQFINGFLSRMEPAILENSGFIDKYIGDAIMALFGNSPDDALKAGIAMLQRLEIYNRERERLERPTLKIGVGINTGTLMLGTVGGQSRMDSTVISDAVNLSSRLEGLTKIYGASLLISHCTLAKLNKPMDFSLRLIDRVQVKGKSQKVSVFEVFDADPPPLRAYKLETKSIFESALLQYYCGALDNAIALLQDCLQINPEDTVATIYLKRCQQLRAEGVTVP